MISMLKKILVAALLTPLLAFATTPVKDHGLPLDTSGTPSNTIGNAGDVAIDPNTGVLYLKDATAGWQASYTPSASNYNPAAVAITGGSITGTSISGSTGSFSSVTDTGLTANGFTYSGAGGLLQTTAAPTNGQLLIGSTGAAPVAAALTGTASQIAVTNGAGSITLGLPSTLAIPGTVTSVNGITTAGTIGIPIEVAVANFTNQTANIASTALYNVPVGKDGRYRVTANIVVVTPAAGGTPSSTCPLTNIAWTDSDSGGLPSANIGSTGTGNSTSTVSTGQIVVYAKGGTAINVSTQSYATAGTTAMAFNARYQVEYLGN